MTKQYYIRKKSYANTLIKIAKGTDKWTLSNINSGYLYKRLLSFPPLPATPIW